MARTLKKLPEEMYVVETTVTHETWRGPLTNVYLLGPYTTFAAAKGQATASAWNGGRQMSAKFFKGTISWEAM